jgi:flagellar biosynthesis/type III secretory pathway chaperone
MNLQNCREPLSRLINEEGHTLDELAALLEREHALLAANGNVDALEDACEARQICMGMLLRVQDERRGMLRLLNLPDSVSSLDHLLSSCDADGTLRAHWVQTLDTARRCRELNDRNGALVNARMRRVEGLLNVLTGRRTSPTIYGPQGQIAPDRDHRMLTAQA